MNRIAARRFHMTDQEAFAALSGDCNPLHVDPQAARRTMFGQPIVHGLHLALWSLEEWARQAAGQGFEALDVRLLKPAYLDEAIHLECLRSGDGMTALTCRSSGAQLCGIKITHAAVPGTGTIPWTAAARSRAPMPIDLAFADLPQRSGEMPLDVTEAEVSSAFPALTGLIGASRVAALLGLTRLVGMECPGLNSIFSSFAVRMDGPDSDRLAWNVAKANPRMSLINLNVSGGGLQGKLVVFYRPTPQAPLSVADIAAAVLPGSMAGRRALVVGGSRGLGRTTAIMLAAGDAEVGVTYRSGRDEADSVAAEIAAIGGTAHVVQLDVAAPAPAIASLAASGFVPDEIYYFATPHIFVRKKELFEEHLFTGFADTYVSGVMRLIRSIRSISDGPLRIFLPSSEALDEPLAELFEYSVAKAAAESFADLLPRFDNSITCISRRLPRLPTDQTRTLMEIPSADPIATLGDICAAMAPATGAANLESA